MTTKVGYRVLRASWPFNDGTGDVGHDVEAVYSEDNGATWNTIPGRHINGLRIDHPGMQGMLNMPDNNPAQIAAKQRVYENLIVNALRKQPGWSKQELLDIVGGSEALKENSASQRERLHA